MIKVGPILDEYRLHRDILTQLPEAGGESSPTIELDFRDTRWITPFGMVLLGCLSRRFNQDHEGLRCRFSLPASGNSGSGQKQVADARRFYFAMQNWGLFREVRAVVDGKDPAAGTDASGFSISKRPDEKRSHHILPITSIAERDEFEVTRGVIRYELEGFLRQLGYQAGPNVNDFVAAIVGEICENVHIHNGNCPHFSAGYVTFHLHAKGLDFLPAYAQSDDLFCSFLKRQLGRPFFELAVGDNGWGVTTTLRKKLPSTGRASETDLLRRAFDKHLFEGHAGVRRGLYDARSAVLRWGGVMRVVTNGLQLDIDGTGARPSERPSDVTVGLPGTYYRILLPMEEAQEAKRIRVPEEPLLFPDRPVLKSEYLDLSKCHGYRETDDESFRLLTPLTKVSRHSATVLVPREPRTANAAPSAEAIRELGIPSAEVVEVSGEPVRERKLIRWPEPREEQRATEIIEEAFEEIQGRRNVCLCVDLARLRENKTAFWERVLCPLIRKHGGALTDVMLFFNASEQIISNLGRADELLAALAERSAALLVFDRHDAASVVGPPEPVADALQALFQRGCVKRKTLKRIFGIRDTKKHGAFETLFDDIVERHGLVAKGKRGSDTILTVPDLLGTLKQSFEQRFQNLLAATGTLYEDGHFVLPSGKHTDTYIESRRLLQDEAFLYRASRSIVALYESERVDCILSYSLPGAALCERVVAHLGERTRYAVARDYEEVNLVLGGGIRPDERVLIVTDVVSSGSLVSRLARYVKDCGGEVVGAAALLDVRHPDDPQTDLDVTVRALLRKPIRKYDPRSCPLCERFIPKTAVHRPSLAPEVVAGGEEERLTRREESHIERLLARREGLGEEEELWSILLQSGAMRAGHFIRDEHHFTYYVDTARLVGAPQVKTIIRRRASRTVSRLLSQCGRIDYVIHPQNYTATVLGEIYADLIPDLPGVLTAVRKSRATFDITGRSAEALQDANVLVVDDATNTGRAVLDIFGLLQRFGANCVGVCILINRLPHEIFESFDKIFPFHFQYFLNLPAYDGSNCPLCREQRDLENVFYRTESSQVRDFCSRRRKYLQPEFLPR
jgi:orotate phosphoribosyltransferase